MPQIENDSLLVTIDPKGAELRRIYHKVTRIEYLWDADPAYWSKSSPVLFPIVGTLKENRYIFEGQSYELSRHGFARDMTFAVEDEQKTSVTFLLASDDTTITKYPFAFQLRIKYAIEGDKLSVTYDVSNPAISDLYFSVGGHPAFRVPLTNDESYNDYFLEFEQVENAGRWMITPDGLIGDHSVPLLDNTNRLPLQHELFYKDAIVLKNLRSTSVSLRSNRSSHGLQFNFPGFPFLGIWAGKDADFVCIEPWCGIADSVNSNQEFTHKEGIEKIGAGQNFSRTWDVRFF